MPATVISVRGLSKRYRLGVINRQTLQDEVRYWWHKVRGRDPHESMGRMGLVHGRRPPEDTDEFWALKDVSCEINAGEVVGIIGRNGAGKSTLLKILSRITEPTEGEAFIEGRVGSLLEVGTGFHPELTGRENIYMNGTILGMKKAEIDEKFDAIVDFSEMGRFIETPVKRYSSGMYVRLAFAVAAHLEPEILIVDEVLAVGDATFQKRCLGKMEDNARSGRTVLFVSHNMPAVLRLCSRVVLLEAGRVAATGPADKMVSLYLSRMAESHGSRSWPEEIAPGSRDVKLLELAVTNAAGLPLAVADVADELRVRLTYKVATPDTRFRCLVVFNTAGVIAFAAVEPTEALRNRPGVYTSVLRVPAHLLAENEYTLNISIFSSRGVKLHHVKLQDVLSFQVTDAIAGDSARGDYAEGLGGVLRPRLDWDTATEPIR